MKLTLTTWARIGVAVSLLFLLYLNIQLSSKVNELGERHQTSQRSSIEKGETMSRDLGSLTTLSAHIVKQFQEMKQTIGDLQEQIDSVKAMSNELDPEIIESIGLVTSYIAKIPVNRDLAKEISDLQKAVRDIQAQSLNNDNQKDNEEVEDDDDDEEDEEALKTYIQFEGADEMNAYTFRGLMNKDSNYVMVLTEADGCDETLIECLHVKAQWDYIVKNLAKEFGLVHVKDSSDGMLLKI